MTMTMTDPGAGVPALAAQTMIEAFRLTAAAHPDRIAVRTPDDGVAYTFADLQAQIGRAHV